MPPVDKLNRIEEMLKSQPNDEFLLFAKAQELRNREKPKAAIAAFEHLRAQHPQYVGLYYHLAELYKRQHHHAEAKECYLTGISVASELGDKHALAELQNAYQNFDLGI